MGEINAGDNVEASVSIPLECFVTQRAQQGADTRKPQWALRNLTL